MSRNAALKRTASRNALKPAGLQVREAVTPDAIMRAFEAFKTANDERLKAIESRKADPLLEDKTNRINDALTALQTELNKRNEELNKRADEIEAMAKRAGAPRREEPEIPGADPQYRTAFNDWVRRGTDAEPLQKRAMSAGSNVEGGYITSPEIDTEIARLARTDGNLRNVARVRTISGGSYSKPVANNNNAAGWVAELEGRPLTSTVTFGGVTIGVHEMYASPAASQTILDDAFTNVESFIAEETSEAFWELEASAFIIGNGVGKPQGIILPSTKLTLETGVTEAVQGKLGYVKSGADTALFSGASPVADAIIDLQTRLKARYLSNARFRCSRFTKGELRKIKDDHDHYIWQPGMQAGAPDVLLGYPLDIDDHMPAIAQNAIPLLFGDFREAYTIVDRIGIRMLRDPYTNKPYVVFYSTKRLGGGYIKTEAMKGLMTAA
jgi:HK97 family phage major capsid protein